MGGTPGIPSQRVAEVTASGRTLSVLMYWSDPDWALVSTGMMECESYVEDGTTFASLLLRTTVTMHYVHPKEAPLMKSPVALAAILSTAALATAAIFPQRVHYIDHDKVAAAFVKGGRIIEDQGLIVIAQRVVGRGSEMHD